MAFSVQQPETGQDAHGPFPPNGHKPPASEYMAAILEGLNTVKNGDFSVCLPVSWTGLAGRIADNFNEIVATNERMALELKRVGQAVGKECRTRERIRLERRRGAWDEMDVSRSHSNHRNPARFGHRSDGHYDARNGWLHGCGAV